MSGRIWAALPIASLLILSSIALPSWVGDRPGEDLPTLEPPAAASLAESAADPPAGISGPVPELRPAGHFEPAGDGRLVGRFTPLAIHFDAEGAHVGVGGEEVLISFPGARTVPPRGAETTGAYTNYIIGNDPDKWRTRVANHEKVVYEGLWDGIDAVFYVTEDGQLEFDFLVAPGTDPAMARFAVAGGTTLLRDDGHLEIAAGTSGLVLPPPVTYQETETGRQIVSSAYAARDGHYGFDLGSYDRSLALAIDPRIAYSTYIGNDYQDHATDVAVAPDGDFVVSGWVWHDAGVFPTTSGTYDGSAYLYEMYVARFHGDGPDEYRLKWATFIGGDNCLQGACNLRGSGESGRDVAFAVDASTAGVLVGGYTASDNFPVRNQIHGNERLMDPNNQGGTSCCSLGPQRISDGAVTVLTPDGTDILFSTFIGGAVARDEIQDVAFLPDGRAAVVGYAHYNTRGPAYPTTGNAYQQDHRGPPPDSAGIGFDAPHQGTPDAVVSVIDWASEAKQGLARVDYSTFLGSAGWVYTSTSTSTDRVRDGSDVAWGLDVDPDGILYVVGRGDARGDLPFPTTEGAYQRTGSDYMPFAAKIDPSQTGPLSLVYSTFIGSGTDNRGRAVALGPAGTLYAAGHTSGADSVPSGLGGAETTKDSGTRGFVVQVSADGSSLLAGTYVNDVDNIAAIARHGDGRISVMGSGAFGDPDPYRMQPWQAPGGNDIPVLTYSADLSERLVRSELGGNGNEFTDQRNGGIAVDDTNARTVVVSTSSNSNFPMADNQFDRKGNYESVVAVLEKLPPVAVITATPEDPTYPAVTTVGVENNTVHAFIPQLHDIEVDTLVGVSLSANDTFLGDVGADLDAYTYEWDIGNDTTIEGTDRWLAGLPELNHSKSMQEEVCLTVSDGTSYMPDTTRTCITITWNNRIPLVDLTADHSDADPPPLCTPLRFDLTVHDLDGTVARVGFDRDDGSPTLEMAPGDFEGDATGSWAWHNETHLYRTAGPFLATANATDDEDANGTDDHAVAFTHENRPVAVNDTYIVEAGSSITIDAVAYNVTRNDCDPVDASVLNATLVSPPTFHDDVGGTEPFVFNENGTFTYNAPLTPATDTFTYSVEGTGGAVSDDATVTIIVPNTAPVANDETYSTLYEAPLSVAEPGVLDNDTDVEATPLTAVLVDGPVGAASFTLHENGSFDYTPAHLFSGADTFTYNAYDGQNESEEPATVTINVAPNEPPTTGADEYDTMYETTLFVDEDDGVLDNDDDVENKTFTAVLETGPGNHTSFTFHPNGSFSYTPEHLFDGDDTFTYRAYDGTVYSDPVTVTITVDPNEPPVANPDRYGTPFETELVVPTDLVPDVLQNDTDHEGKPLTAILVSGPAHAAAGSFTFHDNGSFSYTPEDGFEDQDDQFTYKVNDGTDDSAVATVTITVFPVANKPPGAKPDSYNTSYESTLAVGEDESVLVNDEDLETNPAENTEKLTAILVDGPDHAASFALHDNGTFDYTPEHLFDGEDTFTYRADDGADPSDIATVTITVDANHPPVADDDTYDANYQQARSVDEDDGVLDGDTDHEHPTLQAVLVAGPSHASSFTLHVNGSFDYTPEDGHSGADPFEYQAFDGTAYSNTATVTVTTAPNDQPVAHDNATSVDEDGELSLHLDAIDPNGDQLDYTLPFVPGLLGTPPAMTYKPPQHFCTDPDDPVTFTFEVKDPAGASDTGLVEIDVVCINDPPEALDDPANGAYVAQQPTPLWVPADEGLLQNDDDVEDPDGIEARHGSPPTAGVVELNKNGAFRYTPPGGFTGRVTFTYHAWDGEELAAPATVAIDVVAPPARPAPLEREVPHVAPPRGFEVYQVVTDPRGRPELALLDASTAEGHAPGTYVVGPGQRTEIHATPSLDPEARLVYDIPFGRVEDVAWDEEAGRLGFTMPEPPPGGEVQVRILISMVVDGTPSQPVDVLVLAGRGDAPPVAAVTARPARAVGGTDVVVDASASYDPEGLPLSFRWEQVNGSVAWEGEGPVITFTAPRVPPGTEETVVFRVLASDGRRTATDDATVVVWEPEPAIAEPPDAAFHSMNRGAGEVWFEALGNDTGTFLWEFGDGGTGEGRRVVHQYDSGGAYTVRLTVEDGAAAGTAAKDVDVPAYTPVAEARSQSSSAWILYVAVGASLALIATTAAIAVVLRRRDASGEPEDASLHEERP